MDYIGLIVEGDSLKFAKIKKNKHQMSIDLLRTIYPIDKVGLEKFFPAKGSLWESGPLFITGLDHQEIFIRHLPAKLKEKKKIFSTLPYQLETILPFSESECVVYPVLTLPLQEESSYVQITATKKNQLCDHLKKFQDLNIDPDEVSSQPHALLRFKRYFFPELKNTFLFHIGAASSVALYILEDRIEIAYPFQFGTEMLIQALGKDLPHHSMEKINQVAALLDFQNLPPLEYPNVLDILLRLQKELDRIYSFFQGKAASARIEDAILIGSFASFPKLKESFRQSLPSSLKLLSTSAHGVYDSSTLESYAIAIGLALDSAIHDEQSIRFRQHEFLSLTRFRKKTKYLIGYLAVCSFLSLSVFLFGHTVNSRKEKNLYQLCESLFPEYSSTLDIGQHIQMMDKKVGKHTKPSSLILSVPTVSEVLHWISTHPILSKTSDSLLNFDLIEMKGVHYQLTKYPKITTPTVGFAAKVELEFTSPSTRVAREFHEALLKGDKIVDEKKEITWHIKDSLYKTSFYIKHTGESL
ncbi:MAG: hypothetical protein EBZ47_03290 [Chlamydiae bacterium]|nr:hypothetical protein [Chlamydiota bacterium]